MRIAALTCRSYYSLLRGAVPVQRLVQVTKDYGYDAVALADVNSMYGVVDFYKAAKKANIKPIIGVEILTDTQTAILLAEDRTGYKNRCRITTAVNLDANFDVIDQLRDNSKGLICICTQPRLLKKLKKLFPKDYLFVGCQGTNEANFAKANRVKPIAYTNFNITEDDDIATAKLLSEIRQLSVAGPGPQDSCGFNKLTPAKKFKQNFRNCPEAISNSEQLAYRCNLQLLNGKYFLPRAKLPKGKNADKELAQLCHRGLAKKYNPVTKDVIKRLL